MILILADFTVNHRPTCTIAKLYNPKLGHCTDTACTFMNCFTTVEYPCPADGIIETH